MRDYARRLLQALADSSAAFTSTPRVTASSRHLGRLLEAVTDASPSFNGTLKSDTFRKVGAKYPASSEIGSDPLVDVEQDLNLPIETDPDLLDFLAAMTIGEVRLQSRSWMDRKNLSVAIMFTERVIALVEIAAELRAGSSVSQTPLDVDRILAIASDYAGEFSVFPGIEPRDAPKDFESTVSAGLLRYQYRADRESEESAHDSRAQLLDDLAQITRRHKRDASFALHRLHSKWLNDDDSDFRKLFGACALRDAARLDLAFEELRVPLSAVLSKFALSNSRQYLFAKKLVLVLKRVYESLDDVSGMDLSMVKIDDYDLSGVNWSSETVWPFGRVREIRARSVVIDRLHYRIAPDKTSTTTSLYA
ncbi:hypothetical protein VA596_01940 [Amycolatopsis sp., V23-08]|uniref:Uncharacterized protein n=1 Tax=Amycolatopsis heterodermiae TaxID=3110235 RepID=A0ABU5QWI4_9PSEU|nr:hypothetical protein [Amycolatopsis sp., V23-08]MEA5358283.1 hypothetical protein [Amycolatopsis sp., V23-08]